jgi:ABC-2 type transport system ATP-binding protein
MQTDDGYAVQAADLVKTYPGGVTALAGLSLTVRPGEVLGLLGPNGAGKTTTIKILTTLVRPDSGSASIAGYPVLRAPDKVRRVIGSWRRAARTRSRRNCAATRYTWN